MQRLVYQDEGLVFPGLFRSIARMLQSVPEASAEDVVHEAYLRFLERCSCEDVACPRAWVGKVARNLAISCLRSRKRRRLAEAMVRHQAELEDGDKAEALCLEAERRERETTAAVAADRLSPEDRLLIRLRFERQMHHGEIAQTLEISGSVAAKRVAQALAHYQGHVRRVQRTRTGRSGLPRGAGRSAAAAMHSMTAR
jgi:RNA polymerase sigma factor (sigma-70 family)